MKVSLVSTKESHELRHTRGNQSAVISLPATPSVGKGDHGILITPHVGGGKSVLRLRSTENCPLLKLQGSALHGTLQVFDPFVSDAFHSVYSEEAFCTNG